jgi:hypothetical protein
MSHPNFRWSFIEHIMHDTSFEIVKPGTAIERRLGCQALATPQDVPPSQLIIQQFASILQRLPKLHTISSNEEAKHVMVICQNRNGIDFDPVRIKNVYGVLPPSAVNHAHRLHCMSQITYHISRTKCFDIC